MRLRSGGQQKTVNGKKTTFVYDAANQLVSSNCDGKTVKYEYDAAGRLVKEGDKVYQYRWLDKLTQVSESGRLIGNYDYQVGGQLASANQGGKTESFLWDGLALIARNQTSYLNEPAVTGGNPIAADGKVLFNDLLGNTLGSASEGSYSPVEMSAFGETEDQSAFFTGKPAVGELGYAFLFRNYRPGLGKWQTQDPLGYPDGWNNFAYVNNRVTNAVDWMGGFSLNYSGSWTYTEKLRFESILNKVKNRLSELNQQIQTEISNLTELIDRCPHNPSHVDALRNLRSNLVFLKTSVTAMQGHINGNGGLTIIKEELAAGTSAVIAEDNSYIKLNIREGNDWFFDPNNDVSLFHEISHMTNIDDYYSGSAPSDYQDAVFFEKLMRTNLTARGYIYEVDRAKIECE